MQRRVSLSFFLLAATLAACGGATTSTPERSGQGQSPEVKSGGDDDASFDGGIPVDPGPDMDSGPLCDFDGGGCFDATPYDAGPYDGETWDGGPWVPGPAPSSDVRTAIADANAGMVGRWVGVARTPWMPTYLVAVSFSSDGHYTSKCTDSHGECIGFYWGTDEDLANKTFALDTVSLTGVNGQIALSFSETDTSSYDTTIRDVHFDQSRNGLRFEVYNGPYGPVQLDLRRAP